MCAPGTGVERNIATGSRYSVPMWNRNSASGGTPSTSWLATPLQHAVRSDRLRGAAQLVRRHSVLAWTRPCSAERTDQESLVRLGVLPRDTE